MKFAKHAALVVVAIALIAAAHVVACQAAYIVVAITAVCAVTNGVTNEWTKTETENYARKGMMRDGTKLFSVQDFAITEVRVSGCNRPDGAREENIHLNGPEALERIYNHGGYAELNARLNITGRMAWLMYCAPRIAMEIFGYEYGAYREMVSAWTKHYGIYHAMCTTREERNDERCD